MSNYKYFLFPCVNKIESLHVVDRSSVILHKGLSFTGKWGSRVKLLQGQVET